MLLEVDGGIPETAEVCILKILRRVGGQDFEGEVFRKGPISSTSRAMIELDKERNGRARCVKPAAAYPPPAPRKSGQG